MVSGPVRDARHRQRRPVAIEDDVLVHQHARAQALKLVDPGGVRSRSRSSGFSVQPSTEDHSESKIAKESNQGLAQDDDAGKNDV